MNIFSLQMIWFCFIIYLVFAMTKLEKGLSLIQAINQNGYEAYIVGGAVRDFLLNRPIHDVDICTNALPTALLNLFSLASIQEQYFTCRIIWQEEVFEVTTFRKEPHYEDHRHPQVVLATSLKEDIQRRDFTINGLAMDTAGQIIDLCNGKRDLENRLIRTIGKAETRFEEDSLRVLRAVEFSSRLDFELDQDILTSFSKDYVQFLPEEYLITMLSKMFQNDYLGRLLVLKQYQLLKSFPFYQVVAEEALEAQERNLYALFYAKHGFIPKNVHLSKKTIVKATIVGSIVRDRFSRMSLFHYAKEDVLEALRMAKHFYEENFSLAWLEQQYAQLPIHCLADLDFDFSSLPAQNRALAQQVVIEAILNEKILNQRRSILNLLENEGLTL